MDPGRATKTSRVLRVLGGKKLLQAAKSETENHTAETEKMFGLDSKKLCSNSPRIKHLN